MITKEIGVTSVSFLMIDRLNVLGLHNRIHIRNNIKKPMFGVVINGYEAKRPP
ncbi:hypothetical protein DOT_4881 [Desulfosporosinus sp. OT]|nr:hypothetical protein DOT_4881 [Desulfosporosinus sp. OT]